MQFMSVVFYIWSGIIIGISFIATPVKFLAPNLPLAQALSVGRVTFKALSWVDGAIFLILCISWAALWAFKEKTERAVLLFLIAIGVILAVQYLWINPILDARLLKIVSGVVVEKSDLHRVYIFFEMVKLIFVLSCGLMIQNQHLNK